MFRPQVFMSRPSVKIRNRRSLSKASRAYHTQVLKTCVKHPYTCSSFVSEWKGNDMECDTSTIAAPGGLMYPEGGLIRYFIAEQKEDPICIKFYRTRFSQG